MSAMLIRCAPLQASWNWPAVVEHGSGGDPMAFMRWYAERIETLRQMRIDRGALLFRDTGITSDGAFGLFTERFPCEPMRYVGGNSPRLKIDARVYTSTELASDRQIALHNELSYWHNYPSVVFFACVVAPDAGGETPLADGAQVLERIAPEIVCAFEGKGVCYVRNLHDGVGVGPSWQGTFETSVRGEVEKYGSIEKRVGYAAT